VYGDLYFSVAEALMNVAEYERAVSVLHALMNVEEWDKPLIWMRVAKSFRELNKVIDALEFYLRGKKLNIFSS
jgi:predicted Zn-dependent protease